MSDGPRDQLYLSLRLASLEKYLEASEPMPFVVDDILVNFDDQRAAATLVALAELSQKTQVLFFTHHERLEELAQGIEEDGTAFALRLFHLYQTSLTTHGGGLLSRSGFFKNRPPEKEPATHVWQ